MICPNCGTQIKAVSFCPRCGVHLSRVAGERPMTSRRVMLVPSVPYLNGLPNPEPTVEIWSEPSLPNGVFLGRDGMLHWIIPRKKNTMYFYMDHQIVGMISVECREDTVGQAFKDMMRSGLELAAGVAVRSSEAYNGQDLPWDSIGEIGHTYLCVPRIRKIRGDPKTGEIKLREVLSNLTLYTEPVYYRFVIDQIIRHAPDAQVKY